MWIVTVTWHDTGGTSKFPCHTGREAERYRVMAHLRPQTSCRIEFRPL